MQATNTQRRQMCTMRSTKNSTSILIRAHLGGGIDGLKIEWGESNFVNPPYSQLKLWCKKAYEEHKKGKTVVMLIPSRTDTAAWHDYCMKATEIRFIRGRLKFGDAKNSAPFPSAVVVFK